MFLVMLAGQVMFGASMVTVTVKEQVAIFPEPSVAFQITVVTPLSKAEPLAVFAALVRTVEATEQLSEEVGMAYVTAAVHKFRSVTRLILAGQEMEGSCASLTVTLKPQMAERARHRSPSSSPS